MNVDQHEKLVAFIAAVLMVIIDCVLIWAVWNYALLLRDEQLIGIVALLGDPTTVTDNQSLAAITHTTAFPLHTQARKVDF